MITVSAVMSAVLTTKYIRKNMKTKKTFPNTRTTRVRKNETTTNTSTLSIFLFHLEITQQMIIFNLLLYETKVKFLSIIKHFLYLVNLFFNHYLKKIKLNFSIIFSI